MEEERKEGGQGEFYLTLTAMVMWQAWQSKAFHHATPYQRQSSLLPYTHTLPWSMHIPQPHPASLPPVSSIPATLCLSVQDNPSPDPQIPSLSKKMFPKAWIAGSRTLRAGTKGKGCTHADEMRYTRTSKLIRHGDAPNTQMTASVFHR